MSASEFMNTTTPFLTRLRWRIADGLSRAANALRGHRPRNIGLDGITGNRASEIETRLCIYLACEPNADELIGELNELADMAQQTWWHDHAEFSR